MGSRPAAANLALEVQRFALGAQFATADRRRAERLADPDLVELI